MTKVCALCGEERDVSNFSTNGRDGQSLRRVCRRCQKARQRRREGCRLRSDVQAAALERANRPKEPKRGLCCNIIAEHPDREWARLYRNGLFRAKYARDPEAERQRMQIYKQAHPEIAGKHRGGRNRLAAARTSDGTLTREVLKAMMDGATHCGYCLADFRFAKKSFDHIIPLSRGGKHSIDNVMVCCWPCNQRKHARTPQEFASGGRGVLRRHRRRVTHEPDPRAATDHSNLVSVSGS